MQETAGARSEHVSRLSGSGGGQVKKLIGPSGFLLSSVAAAYSDLLIYAWG